MAQIQPDAIQGNILQSYGLAFQHVAHLMLHAETPDAARRGLGELVGRVTTEAASAQGRLRETTLNVAVTHSGLEQLGVRASLLARFPDAFREGPRRRAATLGDTGPS